MAKTVGLTGMSGHLGTHLVDTLVQRGYQVRGLARSESPSTRGKPVEIYTGDLFDDAVLNSFVSGCDYIIHSAALISIDGDPEGLVQKTNVEGTRNILRASITHNVQKFIYVSSTHAVIENLGEAGYDESNPYKTREYFAYDWSKAQAEQLVRKAFDEGEIKGSIVRPSSIVGPPDYKPSKLGQAILDLYHGKIPVLPPGGYNFVDVRDLSVALVNCLERGRNGEVYLLSGSYYDMADFAKIIAGAGGKNPPKLRLSFGLMSALLPLVRFWASLTRSEAAFTKEMLYALKNGHPNMDNSKAIRELGLKVRPLEQTIRDFIDWHLKAGLR